MNSKAIVKFLGDGDTIAFELRWKFESLCVERPLFSSLNGFTIVPDIIIAAFSLVLS